MDARPPFVPEALLVDFGGVLVASRAREGWRETAVADVARTVGPTVHRDRIRLDLDAGIVAWRAWKAAMNRPYSPRDLSHIEFWCDFVGADWPGAARDAVRDRASELCRLLDRSRATREPRTGTEDLLRTAQDADVPVAVVSNALCGQVHREDLARLGLAKSVALELYSDEAGIRKPNPQLLHQAAGLLDVPVDRTWYVGDRYDRDVVCGRRAGAGLVVLMRAPDTASSRVNVAAAPDLIVDDPADLCRRLRTALDAGPAAITDRRHTGDEGK